MSTCAAGAASLASRYVDNGSVAGGAFAFGAVARESCTGPGLDETWLTVAAAGLDRVEAKRSPWSSIAETPAEATFPVTAICSGGAGRVDITAWSSAWDSGSERSPKPINCCTVGLEAAPGAAGAVLEGSFNGGSMLGGAGVGSGRVVLTVTETGAPWIAGVLNEGVG